MTTGPSLTRRQLGQGAAALAMLMAFPRMTSAQAAPVVIATEEDVSTLDPHLIRNNHPIGSVIWSVFDSLVRRNADGTHEPRLALSWEQTEPTRWRFKLRSGVKFTNGEDFNADAVKFNFERMNVSPYNAESQLWLQTGLKSVDVVDPLTVDLVTSAPTINMLYWLEEAFIGAPAYLKNTAPDVVGANPVGSGPYTFVEWKQGDRVVLKANPGHWNGEPTIKDVVFRDIPELSSRINELKAGSVDIAVGLTPDSVDQAKSDRSKVLAVNGLRKMHMGISFTGIEPLKDKRVRQALNHAVDVATMIQTLQHDMTKPLASIVNPPNNNPDLKPFGYDPDKAMALLKEAGHTDFEIPIGYGQYPGAKEVSETVAAYLEAVGLKPKVEAYEAGQFQQMLRQKAFKGIYYHGWASLINPSVELVILTSDAVDNSNGYNNPDYDKLVKTASATLDEGKRKELLTQAETLIWDDCPWLYLWYLPAIYGVSNRLDFAVRPDDYIEMYRSKLVG
jgi:peptide/nickel transport system substrate-binding protein